MKNVTRALLGTATLLIASFGIHAEPVFKSIDESGNVTYADRPVDDAIRSEPVEVPPGPSDEAVEQARERAGQAIREAERLAEEREEQQRERRTAAQRHPAAPPPYYGYGPGEYDFSPPAWYPSYPAYPALPPRPGHRYPPEWQGPGDHPAYRPGPPYRPGHRPGHPGKPLYPEPPLSVPGRG